VNFILSLIGGFFKGPLSRILDTVDHKIQADTDKEALKAEIIKTYFTTRADFMRAGGFWLMLLFAVPAALHFGAVVAYSILWCRSCVWPQPWSIAALPSPMDSWEGAMVLAIFGVVGLNRLKG